MRYVLLLPWLNAPVYQFYTLSTLKKNLAWFVVSCGRSSILHYKPLTETNTVYVQTLNSNVRVRL